jgi:hypothetical protein
MRVNNYNKDVICQGESPGLFISLLALGEFKVTFMNTHTSLSKNCWQIHVA